MLKRRCRMFSVFRQVLRFRPSDAGESRGRIRKDRAPSRARSLQRPQGAPMKLLVKGKNIDVSRRVQEYAEKRLSKLSLQLDDDVTRMELEITEEKNPRVADCHVAEATVWTKGSALRAKEASHDVYASIDLVAEKL